MSAYFNLDVRGLQAELDRRHLPRFGNKQALQTRLIQHDKRHGDIANIIKQVTAISFHEQEQNTATTFSTLGTGGAHNPANLVDEGVLHWSLNDEGSNLKLYFKSGQMVNIAGDRELRYGQVALDDNLHNALQALTGCKDFCKHQGTNPDTLLRVIETTLARRVCVVSKYSGDDVVPCPCEETHIVVGLTLEGMKEMGYIYAHNGEVSGVSSGFGDVSVGGLQWGTYKKEGAA